MKPTDKIYIAGHNGLVGNAIFKLLKNLGYSNIIIKSSKELDLRNKALVDDFFINEKPQFVILAAAKVGGIHANNTRILTSNMSSKVVLCLRSPQVLKENQQKYKLHQKIAWKLTRVNIL